MAEDFYEFLIVYFTFVKMWWMWIFAATIALAFMFAAIRLVIEEVISQFRRYRRTDA